MGASAGLGGNGMVFDAKLRQAREWDAFGVTEDLELHARLVAAGVKVGFAPEASVLGDMPLTLAASRGQNMRWERGRLALARHNAPRLFAGALRGRDWSKLLTAIDMHGPAAFHRRAGEPRPACGVHRHRFGCRRRAGARRRLPLLAFYVIGGLASARAPLRLVVGARVRAGVCVLEGMALRAGAGRQRRAFLDAGGPRGRSIPRRQDLTDMEGIEMPMNQLRVRVVERGRWPEGLSEQIARDRRRRRRWRTRFRPSLSLPSSTPTLRGRTSPYWR